MGERGHVKVEVGMGQMDLSNPRAPVGKKGASPAERPSETNADMTWLDLEHSCEYEPRFSNGDDQARADMDWLDLKHAVGGAAGSDGVMS